MKLLTKNKSPKVRIIIGKAIYGKSGISKPTKTLLIQDAKVQEVFDKIKEVMENESK